jgi:hypothetical protein
MTLLDTARIIVNIGASAIGTRNLRRESLLDCCGRANEPIAHANIVTTGVPVNILARPRLAINL